MGCCGAPPLAAQSELGFEPYSVFVAQDEAFARCGPADDYYQTDPLRPGQELEVYAETDDGWLGIRPPADSFSWIPATTVEMNTAGDAGTVTEDRTVAWIGTQLGRARKYRWQVQLAKGESVTIVGRSEREGPDGPQLWYRIVPPSGEYRWVHREQVVETSEQLVAILRRSASSQSEPVPVDLPHEADDAVAQQQPEPELLERPDPDQLVQTSGESILASQQPVGSGLAEPWRSSDARDTQPNPAALAAPAETMADAMQRGGLLASVGFLSRPRLLEISGAPAAPTAGESATDANWVVSTSRAGSVAAPASSSRVVAPASHHGAPASVASGSILQVSAQSSLAAPPIVSAERMLEIEAETRGADVERLNLVFSRLMAAQATAVEIEPLARAARQLAVQSTDPVIAGRASELAERAERYRRVAQHRSGQSAIQQVWPAVSQAAYTPAASPVSTSYDAGSGTATGTLSGYLVQVYSARANSPPYALTDDSGRTIAYVTPSPGVNLRIHLNSKVQVSGNAGFLSGLNTPHLLALEAGRVPQ
jgi:hypothetical protein